MHNGTTKKEQYNIIIEIMPNMQITYQWYQTLINKGMLSRWFIFEIIWVFCVVCWLGHYKPRKVTTSKNNYFVLNEFSILRSEEEATSIFRDGKQFIDLYLRLTGMSLRPCQCGWMSGHYPRRNMLVHMLFPFSWPTPARFGHKEWFLRPKLHVSRSFTVCAR